MLKEKLRQRITELEDEVRKHKEAQENERQKVTVEDEVIMKIVLWSH